ncbi:MAG: response regulator [Gammaproteobacteria bacterium]
MTETTSKILIVDDDKEIRDLLGQFLSEHGFETILASDGKDMARALAKNDHFDLIILDLMMPGEDGLSLCKKVRQDSDTPIIMITAVGQDVDRIIGLEVGADDFISKPFNPRELLARVRAILRRSQSSESKPVEVSKNAHTIYEFAGWSLDHTSRHLHAPDGLEMSISAGEFDLLLALLKHPQQVLSRDQLLDITKNREAGPFDRSIDIQISRLRRKIEHDPKKPSLIKTVRGGGYVLSCVVKRADREV